MRIIRPVIALLAFSSLALAETVVFRPGAEGKDAVIWNRKDAVGKNFSDATQFHAGTWTWNNDNLGQGTFRSLIEFDLAALPKGAVIGSAKLFLYHDTTGSTKGHTSLSTSNAAQLLRVKAAWAESTVTWENQPATDTAGLTALPKSPDALTNYLVDVTAMVKAMLTDSIGNHGFLMRSLDERPYNELSFASGDNADSAARPSLAIEYDLQTTTLGRASVASPSLRFRIAAGALRLDKPVGGVVVDARGRVAARIDARGWVSLLSLRSGAYFIQTETGNSAFVLP